MKEYTIILDDEELETLMTALEHYLHTNASFAYVEETSIRGVIKQIQIQKDRNKEDYE